MKKTLPQPREVRSLDLEPPSAASVVRVEPGYQVQAFMALRALHSSM